MYVLGVNAYHADASACLVCDGQLIAAAEEERFRRIKYWAGFPTEAIRYCLAEGGVTAYDLDHVGVSRNPSANLLRRLRLALSRRPSFRQMRERLGISSRARNPKAVLAQSLDLDATALKAEFHNVEHHTAHMASAFFVSPFDEAAVLSMDGMGDMVSTMWGVGRGNRLKVLGAIHYPHSLGWLYTALTQLLGFPKYGDQGKVMGLAAYGEPMYLDALREVVRLQRDGTFELDLDYFSFGAAPPATTWDAGAPAVGALYSQELADLLGPPRRPQSRITGHHQDVAASLQAMLEEAEFNLVNMLQAITAQTALCLAGGVALNSVFNGKVLPNTDFEDIHIHPAAGDAGTALGTAYHIYHHILDQPRTFVLNHAYTGPGYPNARIRRSLEDRGLTYQELGDEQLVKRAAQIVAQGRVLGWFQGRMEWGPRALGNRSIIADPRREDMRDILNTRVKHREHFRPYAPSILLEATGSYFDQDYPDPFMIKVYNVLPEKRGVIPAVTHVDGTGRLQTIDRQTAPLYRQLIEEFDNLTGVPVVLNTSFNENEPIVCKPEEAIDCYLRTDLDALVIGNFLLRK